MVVIFSLLLGPIIYLFYISKNEVDLKDDTKTEDDQYKDLEDLFI